MNPIRWAFWHIVKDKIHSENYRRKMIPIFFEVIEPYFHEAVKHLDKNPESIKRKEMIEINKNIIEDLFASDLKNP